MRSVPLAPETSRPAAKIHLKPPGSRLEQAEAGSSRLRGDPEAGGSGGMGWGALRGGRSGGSQLSITPAMSRCDSFEDRRKAPARRTVVFKFFIFCG